MLCVRLITNLILMMKLYQVAAFIFHKVSLIPAQKHYSIKILLINDSKMYFNLNLVNLEDILGITYSISMFIIW